METVEGSEKALMRKLGNALLLLLLLSFVCTLLTLAPLIRIMPAEAVGENWLTGWTYRKQHIITNSSASAGTGYQTQIVVNSSSLVTTNGTDIVNENGHAKVDWTDVRFTASDGSTLLSAYNETQNATSVTCWVKITDTLTAANATIYVYYGNSGASAYWSGDNTFLFFDYIPADGGTLNTTKWVISGTVSIASNQLKCSGDGGNNYAIQNSTTYPYFTNNVAARLSGRLDVTGAGNYIYMGLTHDNTFSTGCVYPDSPSGALTINTTGFTNTADSAVTTDHIFDVEWISSTSAQYIKDGSTLATHTTYVSSVSMGFGDNAISQNDHTYLNWGFIRKYFSPEPSHGGWGPEETYSDTTAPTFGNVGSNQTIAGNPILCHVLWADNVAVSGFILSTNNTGPWVNQTWTVTSNWGNGSFTLNATVGVPVGWREYGNDSSNNWNLTTIQTVTTVSVNLNLHTVDVNANTLTGSTVYMTNGTTIGIPTGLPPGSGYAIVGSSTWFVTATTNGWANYTGITNSTIYVYVAWYGLNVDSITQLTLTGNTTMDLSCLAYPFTVNTVRFWAASNATITASSYTSNILTLSFSGALNNYTLISSCPVIPRYILNVTYDIATCFTTYLSLKHYANATLTLSYESWGDLYVQATDQTLISASIVSGQLLIVPNGTHGLISTLSVHCGSLGNPTSTGGFTAGTFGMSIYSGTYVLNGQTLTLGWATSPFTSGIETTSTTGTSLSVNIVLAFPSSAGKGQVVNGTLTVTWNTYAVIYIWQVLCAAPYSSWIVNVGSLPLALQSAQAQGSASLNVTLTIPKDVADGNYQVPCSVTLQTPTGVAKTVGSTVSLTIGAVAPALNISIAYLWVSVSIGMFLLLFVTMFVRRRSRTRQF
jgi:hypothetical protein